MAGDQAFADHESHLLDTADDRHLMMSIRGRYGVIVAMEADQRQRTGLGRLDTSGLELVVGNREQRLLLLGQKLRLRA